MSCQMHILHVIDGLPLGGAERMLVDLANATLESGQKVSVCVTRQCVDMARELSGSIPVHVLGRHRRFQIRPLLKLGELIRKEKVDLIQAHSRSTLSLLTAAKALGACNVPIILHDHYGSIETDRKVPAWFRVASRFSLSRYVGVYSKLGTWAEEAGVPTDRIHVIGNALDLARLERAASIDLNREFGVARGKRIGVVVAGIRPDKGTDVLLKALALRPLPPDVHLLIVGGFNCPEFARECIERTKTLGLEDSVSFTGARFDVPSIVRSASFAVMPSRSESGPLVLVEYMMAKLPVVSTLVGDIAWTASKAGLQEFVPPDNPLALREALERLWSCSATVWSERAENGRRIVVERFEIRNVLKQWMSVYSKTLGRDVG